MQVLEITRQRLRSYEELVQTWKREHEEARAQTLHTHLQQMEFDNLLKDGLSLWNDIESLHQSWLEDVSSQKCEPDLRMDQLLHRLSQTWITATGRLCSIVERQSTFSLQFEHGPELQEQWREASAMLACITEPTTPITALPPDVDSVLSGSDIDMSRYDD